jgi:hypothetical protein
VPHQPGGVQVAIDYLKETAEVRSRPLKG